MEKSRRTVLIRRAIILSVAAVLATIIITLLCLYLIAPSKKTKYTYELAKQEFSQYEADLNTAVVLDDSYVYFYDRTIRLPKMVSEEYLSNFRIIKNNIYFTAKDIMGPRIDRYINYAIYKCDLYGNNVVCLLRKENLDELSVLFSGDIVYMQHKSKGDAEIILDSYNLITGEYLSVACGEDCDINQYKEEEKSKKYSFKYKYKEDKSKFTIQSNETSGTFVGDDDYIKQTPYYKSLSKYPYELDQINEYNGKIYLVYSLFYDKATGWFPDYTVAVFEFDFASKELIYKSLVEMYDIEAYEVINIEG